ncbi:superoxide dismutase [candidate division WWE3 bacterium RIFCSPLOWO2_01_FULL_39_13]|uniref:Superoxide dismutase n=1 Tax=candidate division WWE3 bacterium RIFCSPLOWO2_01_FULL_39_13 TaxID=1802624 RepID=A0A1F4V5C4_UNCKA|nr:MAG: superoxide dismutase [candidate division WWE3 bacterium RIFCSPLOWO2_01_FULL_39_13]
MKKYALPQLKYPYNALEPYIDAMTMEVHYSKHHQGYLDKLNETLMKLPSELDTSDQTIENLVRNESSLPEEIRSAIVNSGGGFLNHSFFWKIMTPNLDMSKASEELKSAITSAFGSFESMKEQFSKSALTRFGSGWAWLAVDVNGSLVVVSTANQEAPAVQNLSPILGIDVWEHAYYLKYQNRRAEYIENWWNVVNWKQVSENYSNVKG